MAVFSLAKKKKAVRKKNERRLGQKAVTSGFLEGRNRFSEGEKKKDFPYYNIQMSERVNK